MISMPYGAAVLRPGCSAPGAMRASMVRAGCRRGAVCSTASRWHPTIWRMAARRAGTRCASAWAIDGHRPTADLAQYAVPGVERLYLVGPFLHPGGGVYGAGRATAMKMMHDLHLDFDKVARAKVS